MRSPRHTTGAALLGLAPDTPPVGITPGEIEARAAHAIGMAEHCRLLAASGGRFEDAPCQRSGVVLWDFQQAWFRRSDNASVLP